MKRLLYLTTVALVALLLFVPTAMAQEMEAEVKIEETVEKTMEKDLPKSGGVGPASLALPAAALLIGGSVLGYAVLRRM